MTWHHKFLEALEYDAWGQVEEAAEAYHRLQVAAAAVSSGQRPQQQLGGLNLQACGGENQAHTVCIASSTWDAAFVHAPAHAHKQTGTLLAATCAHVLLTAALVPGA
jgi:hypothetical protein